MKTVKIPRTCLAAMAACALCAAVPLAAAASTPASRKTTPPAKAGATAKKARAAWPAEKLSGKILSVDAAHKVVVVQADQIPYDMIVTAKTQMKSGGKTVTLQDLARDKNQRISVNFVPESRGDIARTLQLGG
ncbi:MAG TPA: hypothetical protein VMU19_01530 [Bryobacteraceae bacterium]|nr:hypothetical protein [Bryobacteraceae bacterium]